MLFPRQVTGSGKSILWFEIEKKITSEGILYCKWRAEEGRVCFCGADQHDETSRLPFVGDAVSSRNGSLLVPRKKRSSDPSVGWLNLRWRKAV